MQDNNCDDPHADLVMSKKALSLFQEDEDHGQRKTKRKVAVDKLNSYKPSKRGMCPVSNVLILCKLWDVMSLPMYQARTMEYYKLRFRKNLAQLLEEEAGEQEGAVC